MKNKNLCWQIFDLNMCKYTETKVTDQKCAQKSEKRSHKFSSHIKQPKYELQ
jgi:hypothetical protein